MQQQTFFRRLIAVALFAVALVVMLRTATAQGAQPILSAKLLDSSGQPLKQGEAILLYKANYTLSSGSNKWKPAADGVVTFTEDDLPTQTLQQNTTEFTILARSQGAGATSATLPAKDAKPALAAVDLRFAPEVATLNLEFVAAKDTTLPADLKYYLVPTKLAPAYYTARYNDNPGDVISVTQPARLSDGKAQLAVSQEMFPLCVIVDHPGFLRGWMREEQVTATEPNAKVKLPQPVSARVSFHNIYADEMPADAEPKLKVTTSMDMPDAGGWIVQTASYTNPAGQRTWNIVDLAPGQHYFSATEGLVDSRMSMGKEYPAGTKNVVSLSSHKVIPAVVAVDETGTTLTDFSSRLIREEYGRKQGTNWVPAKDGSVRFQYEALSNRYSGDQQASRYDIEVRAPGYALAQVHVDTGAPSAPPVVVTVPRGKKIELQLTSADGRPVPADLQPSIIETSDLKDSLSGIVHPTRAGGLAVASHVDGNRWSFSVPEETKSFHVAFHDKDFLQAYCSPAITDFADGKVELRLPAPARLSISTTITSPPLLGDDADRKEKYFVSLVRKLDAEGGEASVHLSGGSFGVTSTTVHGPLAPGNYKAAVRAYQSSSNDPSKDVTLAEGETTTVELVAQPPSPNADRLGRSVVKLPKITVTDESGTPVHNAKAGAYKIGSRYIPNVKWHDTNSDGVAEINLGPTMESSDGDYALLVRAPGKATYTGTVTLPATEPETTITMKTGKPVNLKVITADGRAIPEKPGMAIFPESWGKYTWLSVQPNKTSLYGEEKILNPTSFEVQGSGEFTLQVDETSTEPLYLLIHDPEFLMAFQAGPYLPQEWATSGTVSVELPEPGSVTTRFDLNKEKMNSEQVTMELARSQKIPGQNTWSLRMAQEVVESHGTPTQVVKNLAPGSYTARVIEGDEMQIFRGEGFSASEAVKVASGEESSVTLTYAPFKPEWLKGSYTATVKILDQTGKPAAGKPYKVSWYETGYPQQTIAEGTVPEDGIIRLENLAGVTEESTPDDLKKTGGAPSFDVHSGSLRLGYIAMFEYKDKKYSPPKKLEFEFNIPPGEGDLAPDMEMVNLETSQTMRLSDLNGKVVLIDFWATWCGPCQGPMAENQQAMKTHAAAWKDKAVILAVSIDDEMDTVKKHLAKNGWNETLNTWAAPAPGGEAGWQAPAAKLYGINSIPAMLLVDKDGKIVKRGYMNDVAQEINTLLN